MILRLGVELPTITLHPAMPMTVRTGENIHILCEASGEQPIHIYWHSEDNRPFPPLVHFLHRTSLESLWY